MTEYRKLWESIYGRGMTLTPDKMLEKARRKRMELNRLASGDPEAAELEGRASGLEATWRTLNANRNAWHPVGTFPVKPLTIKQLIELGKANAKYDFIRASQETGWALSPCTGVKLAEVEKQAYLAETHHNGTLPPWEKYVSRLGFCTPATVAEEQFNPDGVVMWKLDNGAEVRAESVVTVRRRWPDAEMRATGWEAVFRQGAELVGCVAVCR